MDITILGPGCINCKKVEQIAKEAVVELDLQEATFQHVTNWEEIMKYPILRTPGLVVNGKVVCSGRIPTKAEVISWLTTAMKENEA